MIAQAAAETLEQRRLLAFTATGFGPIARFTGDSSSGSSGDVLAFDTSGGMLVHNRAGDPGFNSAFDFDSSVAGDQTIAADATTRVYITLGGGPDTLIFGNAIAAFQQPASTLLAQFEIRQNASPSDGVKVVVDDTTSAVANTFEVAPGRIVATGINVRYGVTEAYSVIDVIGGSAADTFNVTPSPTVPYLIDGGDPAAAPGDVLNYDANFADATDNGTQITQAGKPPVNYQNVETVNLLNETADASQLVVKNANNFGPNSLRNAINLANFLPGPNTITFDIPGGGVHTITPKEELPTITDPVVIDGYTQPGATPNTLVNGDNAVLKVVLSGHGSDLTYGLDIAAGNSTVRGLVINEIRHPTSNGSDGKGILVRTNGGNTIEGNFIGTDVTGTVALGNGGTGVLIAADANVIGGTTAGARNIITDNNLGGVVISFATGNRVEGNFIGTDATGTANLGNNNSGVDVQGGTNNTIGGTAAGARNIISGNLGDGVTIRFSISTGNRVEGNFIGTDVSGTAALGNSMGVSIFQAANNTIGGTTAGARNIISGNASNGVFIGFGGATGNHVEGNFIGTDVTGTADLGNDSDGVHITTAANSNTIGGPTAAHRNVIAGNSEYGIEIGAGGDNNRILGNYIGTDITGNTSLPNYVGIGVTGESIGTEIGGPAPGEGNVITGVLNGISLEAGESLIRGNRIGTNAAGTAALVNGNVGIQQVDGKSVIGGPNAGDRNIISGWNAHGISFVSASGSPDATAEVYGNYIGTDVTGTIDLGNNLGIGVSSNLQAKIGGAAPGQGNLISGNTIFGVSLSRFAFGVQVYGNRIGTDVTGTLPLGNGSDGVFINGSNNFVGNTGSGQGNIIAFNGENGVNVRPAGGSSATSNSILSNSIFSNTLLGIDLNGDGVTPNDPGDVDNGPNRLTNKPTVNTAFTNVTGVGVNATLEAQPSSNYIVQFFASPGADPSGEGEGKRLLGTVEVNTDPSGSVTFTAEFPFAIPAGQVVTATATNGDGTSEFSAATTITGNPPRLSIDDVTVTEGNGVPATATFTIKLSDPVAVPITVDFATADGTAIAQGDYLSHSGTVTFSPGETTRTVTVTVNPDSLVEGTETFKVNLSNAQIADISDGQGVGTILDGTVPPPPPTFSINDITLAEGNGSGTTAFTFTVTRNGNLSAPSSVKVQTANDSAAASGDFAAVPLTTVNFGVGETSKTVTVNVVRDTTFEPTEQFFVNLSSPTNGTIADGQGIGTITNDDSAPPDEVFVSALNPTYAANGYGQYERNKSNGENGNNDGQTIKLNGVTYAKGLGVHANSELRYALNGQYTRFTSYVGLDDEVGSKGSVIFQVWVDGVKKFDSGVMTGNSATQFVDINVTGRNQLKLLVLTNGSSAYDHADWADAKLLKAAVLPPPPPPVVSDAFLSDLNPTSSTNGWGAFERDKSNGENGSNDGQTIKLNGVTYAKGLGVHANSDLRYALNGQYTRFTAAVGIDDEAGANGSVIFQVWADGVKIFDSGVMTGSSATQFIDKDITGCNELKLLVLSNGSNTWDHADWAAAKVKV